MADWVVPTLVGVVLLGAVARCWSDRGWKELRARTPAQSAWLVAFNSEDQRDVESVLIGVADAFCVRRKDVSLLRPEDKLEDLYRMSTAGDPVDSLEWVFLSRWLDVEYPGVWDGLSADTTLQELVRTCIGQRRGPT